MQNFKTYLTEANQKNLAPWQDPSSPEFVDVDIKEYYRGSVRRNKDGSYSTAGNDSYVLSCLSLDGGNRRVIPVKFSTMGTFMVVSNKGSRLTTLGNFKTTASEGTGLTTLQGAPNNVSSKMQIDSQDLTTLDYLYTKVGYDLILNCPALETFGDAKAKAVSLVLFDIGKVPLEEVKNHFEVSWSICVSVTACYRKPILSLFEVKGSWAEIVAKQSAHNDDNDFKKYKEVQQVCKIMSKHIKSKNILACQRELMKAKLLDYAKF
jgi:hypothetical protein